MTSDNKDWGCPGRGRTEAVILDTPIQIELYRLGVLKYSLMMEARGMTRSGGVSTLKATNQTLLRNGWIKRPHRTKRAALESLEEYIAEKEKEFHASVEE